MTPRSKFLEAVGITALLVLFVASIGLFVRTYNVNECVAGGYAAYRNVRGEHLCFGVVDGEWAVEPLLDVRSRTSER